MQIPCANVCWICIKHEMVHWTLNPSLNIEWFIEYWIKHWMSNMHWILIASLNWIKIWVWKWIGNQFWTLLQMASCSQQKISLAILLIFSMMLLVVYGESVILIGYITRRLSANSQQLWIATENRSPIYFDQSRSFKF